MRKIYLLVCLLLSLQIPASAQETIQTLYQKGKAAYEAKEYDQFLRYMQSLDSLSPQHPTILYNLAAAYSLNNMSAESIRELRNALWLNAKPDYEQDADFQALHQLPAFQDLKKEIEGLKSSLDKGTNLWTLDEQYLHPEGIAFDAKTKQFYLSSVYKGKIIQVGPEQKPQIFAASDTYLSIMGLQVDTARARLWACSTPTEEMKKPKSDRDQAALLEFDLSTGKLLRRYPAPHPDDWLGDLVLNSNGEVLLSNSSPTHPGILKLDPKSKQLHPFLEAKNLISLQGLCLNEPEDKLYFSDYKYGLFVMDLASQAYQKLINETEHPLKGIDGLYFYNNTLIAIHNGLQPFRVVQYELNEAGDHIVAYRFLEKALEIMQEPTLGIISHDTLYYIANSPWGAYDRHKNLILEKVKKPVVRKLDLK